MFLPAHEDCNEMGFVQKLASHESHFMGMQDFGRRRLWRIDVLQFLQRCCAMAACFRMHSSGPGPMAAGRSGRPDCLLVVLTQTDPHTPAHQQTPASRSHGMCGSGGVVLLCCSCRGACREAVQHAAVLPFETYLPVLFGDAALLLHVCTRESAWSLLQLCVAVGCGVVGTRVSTVIDHSAPVAAVCGHSGHGTVTCCWLSLSVSILCSWLPGALLCALRQPFLWVAGPCSTWPVHGHRGCTFMWLVRPLK